MAGYDFGPGLDQASAAYYKALAASQLPCPPFQAYRMPWVLRNFRKK
jgi:hypothetical protein